VGHSHEQWQIEQMDETLAPLCAIVPMQLLAYYLAVQKGCPVDQPRNLAKSVTVE
jgi:glucosamine--fructose-6-phosphate aminotransferase (isomerizing)